jgi:hypothetical protein
MKPTPFNPDTDLAPISFSPELCETAEQLKQHGLRWRPHVGCFVWDKDGHIEASSPFPNRVYFILNMGHFLKRFKTPENMVEHLVWLPTWHQIRQICDQLNISSEKLRQHIFSGNHAGNGLVELYEIVLKELKSRMAVEGTHV